MKIRDTQFQPKPAGESTSKDWNSNLVRDVEILPGQRLARKSSTLGRKQRAVETFRNAAESLGPIERNSHVFAITRGQWSMLDGILHCLDQVGPSFISVWTWSVAELDIEVLCRLMQEKRLTGARLVIDGSARQKYPKIVFSWRKVFGRESVRYVINHAKIATIESVSGFKLCLRGSMSLNFNPRFENVDLSEGDGAFDVVRAIEEALPVLPGNCSGEEIYEASQLATAHWDDSSLEIFPQLRTWTK